MGRGARTKIHHLRGGLIKSAHSKIESGIQNGDADTWLKEDMPWL
jgi:hypothetical protein